MHRSVLGCVRGVVLLLSAWVAAACFCAAQTGATELEPATIEHGSMVLDVQLGPADKDAPPPAPIPRRFDAVILENSYLKVTCIPELEARIASVVSKPSGRELFYCGPVDYTGNVFRAAGANMGGIEVNHPYLHNGNAYCNACPYATETGADGMASVTMAFTSYPLLQRTVLTATLAPDEAALRLTYRFENLAPYEVGFNPWINAVCRPDEDAQIVLPSDWITDHWFGANAEERFHQLYPWPVDKDSVDRSRLRNITDGLTAFAYGVTEGYAGVYNHKEDAGFARVFDPREMCGAKAWVGKKGWRWFEMWAATRQNMEAPGWLAAHGTVTVRDAWFPVQGIGGMTWACEGGGVNFRSTDEGGLEVGVCPTRDLGTCAVRVSADGRRLIEEPWDLGPMRPFHRTVLGAAGADEAQLEVVAGDGHVALSRRIWVAPHPRPRFDLPEKPWFRRNALAEARWHESFSPLCNWGPWWPPVQSYEKVLKDDPGNREAKLGLARALLKDFDGALVTLPDGGRASGRADGAKAERAAQILSELAGAGEPDAEALYLLGLARVRAGDATGAEEAFREVTGRMAAHGPARFELALLAARQGNWAGALDESQAARAAMPDSTLARHMLALALLHEGKPDEATRALVPACRANPADPATVCLLARAAEASGDAQGAALWSSTLDRMKAAAPRQVEAGLAEVGALEAGREMDPRAVDTLSGPPLPGREP